MKEAAGNGAKIIVFPELCITGYTCGDLFTQDILLEQAKAGLCRIAEETKELESVVLSDVLLRWTVSCTTRQRP